MANVAKLADTSGLAEVVDRILDRGVVIDAWVIVSLVGIELITVEARVVIASIETYLKYADAIGLLPHGHHHHDHHLGHDHDHGHDHHHGHDHVHAHA